MCSIYAEIFYYLGQDNAKSKCNIVAWRKQDDTLLVIISEREDNPGTNITNAIETIVNGFLLRLQLRGILGSENPQNITWVENYKHGPRAWPFGEAWNWVSFFWDGTNLRLPAWRTVSKEWVDHHLK